jgi:hypothetical protein
LNDMREPLEYGSADCSMSNRFSAIHIEKGRDVPSP